ncbi:MAG: CHC2 zinc finger domain-containing protein, partial [Saprospiraceae bacterium]
MISRTSIDLIQETARVEDVVGDFVQLRKRGANLIGLCPFHNEKSPSFTVSPAKNIYKCFGCGKAGNPIHFMMEHDNLSYPDAIRYLAKKYGLELEETGADPIFDAAEQEKESLYLVNQFANQFFQ